jgi:hypothetical protein
MTARAPKRQLRPLPSVPTDHVAHNDKRRELSANSARGAV